MFYRYTVTFLTWGVKRTVTGYGWGDLFSATEAMQRRSGGGRVVRRSVTWEAKHG